ncbi:hypothetical protein [Pseudofrankia sp. DC12]|uniref:hypothetical protein n=1 Tax=Pseudofrankia sp. DC12 TaxID=683315 RepID=UPI0005F765F1|nr:hypothetical protein [Pseudofrankia sp. DC12]
MSQTWPYSSPVSSGASARPARGSSWSWPSTALNSVELPHERENDLGVGGPGAANGGHPRILPLVLANSTPSRPLADAGVVPGQGGQAVRL